MKKILMVLLLTTLFQGFAMANEYEVEETQIQTYKIPLVENELIAYFNLCNAYDLKPDLELTGGKIINSSEISNYGEWTKPFWYDFAEEFIIDYIDDINERANKNEILKTVFVGYSVLQEKNISKTTIIGTLFYHYHDVISSTVREIILNN